MAETDSLLKRLVNTFLVDFATWLLGTQVRTARLLPSELPGATVAVDQVCHLTLADERELLWHMEFQGRRSHVPMPWRMLDYMPRLAATYRLNLESVVLYLGRGAGVGDSGVYQVNGLGGSPSLAWRYGVVRLWEMPADTLLRTPQIAPLALVGQTQIAQPEVTLTAVVQRMRQEADPERQRALLAAMIALLPAEEMVRMVERLLTEDDLLEELDLPYLRRLRNEAQAAGRTEGLAAGRTEGLAAGRTEGLAEGRREGEVEMLLRLLHVRFGPLPAEVVARITTANTETLLHWSERIVTAPTIEAVFAPE